MDHRFKVIRKVHPIPHKAIHLVDCKKRLFEDDDAAQQQQQTETSERTSIKKQKITRTSMRQWGSSQLIHSSFSNTISSAYTQSTFCGFDQPSK